MGTNFVRSLLLASASTVAAVAIVPAAAQAQDAGYQLDIPAQPLGDALRALGRATKHNVVFDGAIVRGKRSTAVKGSFSADAALERMLDGTGLVVRRGAGRALMVQVGNGQGGAELASSTGEDVAENVKGISEILVVGSRSQNVDIRRTEDDAQPYVVFDKDLIEKSGARDLGDFLRSRLPQNASLTDASQASTAPQAAVGSVTGIALRGLSTDQTLILVDGRRIPQFMLSPSSPAQPYINSIPMSSIERIEVLPSTAGGIYGGGAVGGVINIIRKRNFSGLDAKVEYGQPFDGGGQQYRIDVSAGFSPNHGRTTFSISGSLSNRRAFLAKQNDLIEQARKFYWVGGLSSRAVLLAPTGYTTNIAAYPNTSVVNGQLVTTYPNLTFKDGTPLGSNYLSIPVGYAGFNIADRATVDALQSNAGSFNLGLSDDSAGRYRNLVAPERSVYADIAVDHEFNANLRIFGGFGYSHNSANYYYSAANGFVLLTPASPLNPFNQNIGVNFPLVGLPLAPSKFDTTTLAGRGGAILKLGKGWSATAEYNWSRSSTTSKRTITQLDANAFAAAINAGTINPLRDLNAFPIDYSPYMVSGYDSITGPSRSTLQTGSVRLGGPLIQLPAGPLNFTGLGEWREEVAEPAQTIRSRPGCRSAPL